MSVPTTTTNSFGYYLLVAALLFCFAVLNSVFLLLGSSSSPIIIHSDERSRKLPSSGSSTFPRHRSYGNFTGGRRRTNSTSSARRKNETVLRAELAHLLARLENVQKQLQSTAGGGGAAAAAAGTIKTSSVVSTSTTTSDSSSSDGNSQITHSNKNDTNAAPAVDYALFGQKEYSVLKKRSEKYYGNNNTHAPIMLGLLAELLQRRSPQWFSSTKGMYIPDAATLEDRLNRAGKKYGIDCRDRKNILMFGCAITKNDDVDLQEWLVWQILITGVHHVIVFMNDPDADNTPYVLKPFIDAGYVTAIPFKGAGRQPQSYGQCLKLIQQKSCKFSGRGNLLASPDCPPGSDIDSYNGRSRPVWVNGFDSDEFLVVSNATDTTSSSRRGSSSKTVPQLQQQQCVVDFIAHELPNENGMMLPWMCYGHSGHFLSPENQLTTEAYTKRMGPVVIGGGMGKAFNRVYFIQKFDNSHAAIFKRGGKTVTEYKVRAESFYNVPVFNATHQPTYRLNHYMTKSVEHLVKKFLRGVADYADEWGRAPPRELSQIHEWLQGYTYLWTTEDPVALPHARVVRAVLTGDML